LLAQNRIRGQRPTAQKVVVVSLACMLLLLVLMARRICPFVGEQVDSRDVRRGVAALQLHKTKRSLGHLERLG
jgi:hypothetical protein